MPSSWPFPGDSPVARARKMALAYRALAEEFQNMLAAGVAPTNTVADLDKRFRDWGERWVGEKPATYDLDDWVPTTEAADLIQISTGALSRARVRGRIKGEWRGQRFGYWYQVRDVYALSETVRGRDRASTDTVPASGGGVPS